MLRSVCKQGCDVKRQIPSGAGGVQHLCGRADLAVPCRAEAAKAACGDEHIRAFRALIQNRNVQEHMLHTFRRQVGDLGDVRSGIQPLLAEPFGFPDPSDRVILPYYVYRL